MLIGEDDGEAVFDEAAQRAVDQGTALLDKYPDADEWTVASGVVAGAVQFWLFSRQPCNDPDCEDCADINTAERRLAKLIAEIREYAIDSDYYHTPHDANVGTA